jgi:hypothetical protein
VWADERVRERVEDELDAGLQPMIVCPVIQPARSEESRKTLPAMSAGAASRRIT